MAGRDDPEFRDCGRLRPDAGVRDAGAALSPLPVAARQHVLAAPRAARRAARAADRGNGNLDARSEEHTSELQSLMRISYAVFCLKKQQHTKLIYSRHRS